LSERWLRFMETNGYRLPTPGGRFDGVFAEPDFVYKSDVIHCAVYVDGSPADYPERQGRDKQGEDAFDDRGIKVVRFGDERQWAAICELDEHVFGRLPAGPASKRAETAATRKTVAVLPFKSIGKDPVDDYLRFGIADVVINKLTGLQEIIVRPLASVSKYGATDKDPITAGKELGVDVVLDGQIQRTGDHYRVTVQLWQVGDGASLSSYACDETCAQIFELEDAVSERAMNALAIRLTTQEQQYLAKRYTDNQAGYDLYLKGRYYFSKTTQEGFAKAAAYFQQAVDLEPKYAPAYAGLSDALYQLAWADSPQAPDLIRRSKIAANKALELDDGLAEAHSAAGGVKLQDWDWSGARAEFERALALKPNYIRALDLYSSTLILFGQNDKAIEVSKHHMI